ATTGGCRARVLDDELRALQVFLVVDLGTDQVLVAHRVDQQRDPILGHGGAGVIGDFVKGEAILETRAAAALHTYAQLEFRVAFFGDQVGHLGRRTVGEDDGVGHLGLDIFGDGAHGIPPLTVG